MDPDVRDDTTLHLANEPNREADPVASPALILTIPGKRRGGPQAFGLPLSEAAYAPIHLLPPELLIDAFKYYTGVDTPVENLIALTLVCKLWRNIVEGTPSLWCFISAKEGLPRVRKALEMAKDALLEIKYWDQDTMADPGTFFAEIIGREAQWKSVIVTAQNINMNLAIYAFQLTTAPNLATLHLKAPRDQKYKSGTVTLFGGKPASTALKDIRVDFVPIAIGPLRLSGLRSLELNEIPIISADEVLRILRASPVLEHCYLYGLVSLQDFALPGQEQELLTLQPVNGPDIHLSRLHSLTLGGLPNSFTHLVLSTIQVPNLEGFSVDCKIDQPGKSPTSELFTTHISHLTPALKSASSPATNIGVVLLSNNAWTLSVGGINIALGGISLQRKHLGETLDWLFSHLGGHLPVSLSFHEFDVGPDWFVLLASTLKVTKLELWTGPFYDYEPEPQPRKIISLLSQPLSSTPIHWLLPELESINTNVVNDEGKSKILNMVKARHSFIEEQEPGAVVLKPFKEILLRGGRNGVSTEPNRNKRFLNALEEVGRGTEIWWEGVKWADSKDLSFIGELE
ncbi:hypothetical protein FRC04_003411 [Tulasnella sp. 424]|nr:hypothetical protein FRC04_003411 [Tulasnella sp. 424]